LLTNHGEAVGLVLRTASPEVHPSFIKELSALTSVISPIFGQLASIHSEEEDASREYVSQMQRTQKLMMSLLKQLSISPLILKTIENGVDSDEGSNRLAKYEVKTAYLNTVVNLLLYAENLVTGSKTSRFIRNVILQPSLEDPSERVPKSELNIGNVLKFVIDGSAHYNKQKLSLESLSELLMSVSTVDLEQLREFISNESLSENEIRIEASVEMMRLVAAMKKELNLYLLIIESALYLCWAHLDYYLLRAIPAKTLDPNRPIIDSSRFVDKAWSETVEQIKELRTGLVPIFDDSFVTDLVIIAEDKNSTEKGYVEGLLHRIRKLLQFGPSK